MRPEDQTRALIEKIDARSEKLSQEALNHVTEAQYRNPEMTDVHRLFEGWIIQKIAGLQVMVEQFAEVVPMPPVRWEPPVDEQNET